VSKRKLLSAFLAMAASPAAAQAPSPASPQADDAVLDARCYGALALEGMAVANRGGDSARGRQDMAAYVAATQFFGGRLTARYPMAELVSVLRATPAMEAGRNRRDLAYTCVQYFQVTMLALAESLRASVGASGSPPR